MGEEIKAMKGQEIDKDKINSIVSEDGQGSPFDLKSMLKTVTTLGFLATGNVMIPLAARIIAGISTGDDKKKDVEPTIKDPKIDKVVKPSGDVFGSSSTKIDEPGYEKAKTFRESKEQGKTTFKAAMDAGVPKNVAEKLTEKQMKAGTDVGTGEDGSDRFGAQNKGGLINKPKRNPKKPRGKGLGSK